jgi:hypothetical protein
MARSSLGGSLLRSSPWQSTLVNRSGARVGPKVCLRGYRAQDPKGREALRPGIGSCPLGIRSYEAATFSKQPAIRGPNIDYAHVPGIVMAIAAYGDNRWWSPASLAEAPAGLVTSDGDMPVVLADSSGRVWVFWQKMKGHLNFRTMATYYQSDHWADAKELGAQEALPEASWVVVAGRNLNGRIDNHAVPLQMPDGSLSLAYERDRGWFTNRDILCAR